MRPIPTRSSLTLVAALATLAGAVSVAAQAGPPPTPAEVRQMEEQAKAAVDTMQGRLKEAEKDYARARSKQAVTQMNCMSDPLKLLAASVRLAQQALLELQGAEARREPRVVKTEYIKISTLLGKAEGYYGTLKGCGGDAGGTIIGNDPVIEKVIGDAPAVNATAGVGELDPTSGYVSSASPFFAED